MRLTSGLFWLGSFVAAGCGGGDGDGGTGGTGGGTGGTGGAAVKLVEDRSVYAQDDLTVLRADVTVAAEDMAAFDNVNNDVLDAVANITFKSGTFGQAATTANATIELRGHSTRRSRQKSYQIKIQDENDLWRNHKVINLGKHPYDMTRSRNKLAFDVFKTLPNMTSLRTQFVNLFVNGDDFGLFTQVEQVNKRFLTSHGLDPNGHVYKAESFEFLPLTAEEMADPVKFNAKLEQKAGPVDHTKINAMIAAVNNWDVDIDATVDRYFERDNYLTWLAMNVLMDNVDTTTQNFMLYSPHNSERWYFIPWDYDAAWGWYEQPRTVPFVRPRYFDGVARYWAVPLHQRFLRKPANATALNAKIDELAAQHITESKIRSLLDQYRPIVRSFVEKVPDLTRLPTSEFGDGPTALMARFESEHARLAVVPAERKKNYTDTFERPMPIWLGKVQVGTAMEANWDPSFDFQGDALTYDVEISKTVKFAAGDIVLVKENLTGTSTTLNRIPDGNYFWRVIIRDKKNPAEHWQSSYGFHWDQQEDVIYYGAEPFTVP